jgi:nitrate/TMAO reductase-like tetraheme cytochrome c subunit
MRSPKLFLAQVTRTRLSMVGTVITTVTAFLFITFFVLELLGFHLGPYVGILGFLVIPALFIVGLLLIPLGLWLDRRKRRRTGEPLPPLDVSSPRTARLVRIFLIATIVNIVIVTVAAFKGVEVMETNEFCGQTCHEVMQPEFTAYQGSPHSRVDCVQCHIGEGASWFVKSKLSGSWQVISVAFDLYPRPIAAPVHALRPARETCEQCHWPEKFVGDRLKVISRFQEDETNTELKTVMLMRVGGTQPSGAHGIHWHVDPRHVVRYRADPSRELIYEVEEIEDGKLVKRFRGPEADKPEAAQHTEWRTMDCVDCHNRPAHTYRPAEDELDRALADGRIDKTIPWMRREGLKALKKEYPSHEAARAGIGADLAAFYGTQAAVPKEKLAAAERTLGDIYTRNVFPHMKITWNTYKNQLGHVVDNGCLRCHNGDHKAEDGAVIAADCDSCHTILADGEAEPEILKTLQP